MPHSTASNTSNLVVWQDAFLGVFAKHGLSLAYANDPVFTLVIFHEKALVVHLVPLHNAFTPDQLIALQNQYQLLNLKLVHLWEDVWCTRQTQVIARIKSLLGINERIHGRKTKVQKIAKPMADAFLNENHLQGAVSSRYKYGLFLKDELVGVATFSALRKMKHSEDYKSAELIRFAIKSGFSITGGLSKLLSTFIDHLQPNDIMSYADRDWGAGEAYLRLQFGYVASIAPQLFLLDESLHRRLKKEAVTDNIEVFNTGSLKFILKT
ncbi:Mom family adenine methylcarbamoylation protein [Pedobacter sp. MW01-1-1]|uniref:Mom family adenine methylcarbamoylation protein n=1 Tax=Pedobacter sp. MW01-1-1 TaxID=3383027 RepID=UPI003FF00D1A